jgi:hypothetical protein
VIAVYNNNPAYKQFQDKVKYQYVNELLKKHKVKIALISGNIGKNLDINDVDIEWAPEKNQ